MTALRERLAQMGELIQEAPRSLPLTQAHIAYFAHVHPDVAAALVAVADALRNAYAEGAVAEWIDADGDGPSSALDALAAALGVSR